MKFKLGFISKLILTLVIFLLLSLLLPIFHLQTSDSLLTATTFLFGILYGFEISVVIANFITLKAQLTIENAALTSIYNLADIMNSPTGEDIKNRIENYLLAIIDYPLVDHLKADFFAIFKPLKEMTVDPETSAKGQALQYLNEGIYYIPQSRRQVSDLAPRFVNKSEWMMLIVIALFLVVALFLGRDATLFSQITTAVFSTAVVGSLLLLDDIDSNEIMESYLEYGMFNETLKSLGKDPYYPEFAIKDGTVVLPKGRYRLGKFPKFPSLEGRVIEIKNG